MLRSDRLVKARGRGKSLASAGTDRVTSAIRGRKSLVYAGAALALAGSATAATIGAGSAAASPTAAASTGLATARPASASAARAGTASSRPESARRGSATDISALDVSALDVSARALGAGHAGKTVAATTVAASVRSRRSLAASPRLLTWKQVRDALNEQTNPAAAARGKLPLADRLMPVGTSGPQQSMPISRAQKANATTIVRQAMHKRLGVRSAVIAVATAMQESMLQNIGYGSGESLGLFQQQPDCGWGSAAQIMDPAYSADAFLTALQSYQQRNPFWAQQPLWQAAQGVQKSAFPYAYAKWEAEAARLVQQIAMHLM